jgi:hypothetical protein
MGLSIKSNGLVWGFDEISPIQIRQSLLDRQHDWALPENDDVAGAHDERAYAASFAPASQRYAIFSVKPFDGVPKLAIWNTGPGMDADELYQMCDLAASIRKDLGLAGNFGMGAKVTSLPSNRLGLRYRSGKERRVHEVILCERKGVYGRLRRRAEDGTYPEAIERDRDRCDGGSRSLLRLDRGPAPGKPARSGHVAGSL